MSNFTIGSKLKDLRDGKIYTVVEVTKSFIILNYEDMKISVTFLQLVNGFKNVRQPMRDYRALKLLFELVDLREEQMRIEREIKLKTTWKYKLKKKWRKLCLLLF